MLDMTWYSRLDLADVAQKIAAGERLSLDDGARLFACPEPTAVGALAHFDRLRRHGTHTHYVVNRHINYTNICVNRCRFCAYRCEADQDGAFTLDSAEIAAKLGEPATEVHVVGGCHPELPLSYYEALLGAVARARPEAMRKCFSAVEIAHFAAVEGVSEHEVLTRLKAAGLDMLPGGGAEIFAPEVRTRICPEKIDAQAWLDVHRQAHGLGIKSNCTMLFGHIERVEHRLEHLDALRRLQDETGGFVCFIPLPYLDRNNPLADDAASPLGSSGLDELRTIAVSRLMLDNIPHVKAYWIMLGVLQAQNALLFGADDLDGTVVEERIGRTAGAESTSGGALTKDELTAMIRALGLTPVERDGLFRPLNEPEEAAC